MAGRGFFVIFVGFFYAAMWPCSKQPACNRLTKAEVRMLFDPVGVWCIWSRPVVIFFSNVASQVCNGNVAS